MTARLHTRSAADPLLRLPAQIRLTVALGHVADAACLQQGVHHSHSDRSRQLDLALWAKQRQQVSEQKRPIAAGRIEGQRALGSHGSGRRSQLQLLRPQDGLGRGDLRRHDLFQCGA